LYYQEALTVGTVLTAKEYIRHKSYKISSLKTQTNNGKMKESHQQNPEKPKARNWLPNKILQKLLYFKNTSLRY
jgi:hypothetical protein